MSQPAHVGEFCPNPTCEEYGQLQENRSIRNIKKFGKTRQGRQRYRCKSCGQTFSETKDTLFYRRRVKADEILETLALLAEGVRISVLARVKGHKEDTIRSWLYEAGQHAEALEEVLLTDYQITRGQLDGLWSYVKHKGEKKGIAKRRKPRPSGVRR
jgi:transposase-like protein